MNQSHIPRKTTDLSPGTLLLPPVMVTALLWLWSPHQIETIAVMCSFFLLLMPWGSYVCWRRGTRNGLPLFSMIAGMYWVSFGLPLFLASRTLMAVVPIAVSERTIAEALVLALVGVLCLWTGMRIPVSLTKDYGRLPDVIDLPASWAYVRVILIGGILGGLSSRAFSLVGSDARQVMVTLLTVVPNVAFVLLLRRYLIGTACGADKVVLLFGGLLTVVGGLASGNLGPVIGFGGMCGAVILLTRRRVPWELALLCLVTILFFQPGKPAYRGEYWGMESEVGILQRVQFWIEKSMSLWADGFQLGENTSAQGLALTSLERVALLSQVAHVVDVTPSDVPFQEGVTYRFISVALVPRFLWPDKPDMSDANRFYQVTYGLTAETNLQSVAISVGALAEGYINFGWAGAMGVMFLIGIALGTYERMFGVAGSSRLFLAIGVTLLPGLLAVESQLGQYLGGVLQQALMALLVFLPITRRCGLTKGLATSSVDVVHGWRLPAR